MNGIVDKSPTRLPLLLVVPYSVAFIFGPAIRLKFRLLFDDVKELLSVLKSKKTFKSTLCLSFTSAHYATGFKIQVTA